MTGSSNEPADPCLTQAVIELIWQFGPEAVVKEAKRQTARKRGRKPDPDLQRLGPEFRQDARDLLDGRELRTNYEIAKKFAAQYPGHNAEATHKRVEKKLRASRLAIAWPMAAHICADRFPFPRYLWVLEQMVEAGRIERSRLASAHEILATYREKIGEPPEEWSMSDLSRATRQLSELASNASLHTPLFGPRSLLDRGRN